MKRLVIMALFALPFAVLAESGVEYARAGSAAGSWSFWSVAAAVDDDPSVINEMVDDGFDVNTKDEDGWTLLHYAASRGNVSVAKALIEAGADVGAREKLYSLTPMHFADTLPVMEALSAAGADINAEDRRGLTPLQRAVLVEALSTVEALIAAGADINAKSSKIGGSTPLHHAARFVREGPIIEMLVAAGADIHAEDDDGDTPLDVAKSWGNELAIDVMLRPPA